MSIETVFENEHWWAVDKPAEWLSVPGRMANDSRPILGRELERLSGLRLFPVHRLDFEVGGLILWAKTPEAHRRSQVWFESRSVHKFYLAGTLVGPHLPDKNEWQEWRSRILRGKKRAYASPHGDLAITKARLLVEDPDHLQWELSPVTGRSHQLRFELADHGFPILGDTLYGGPARAAPGIALRSCELDFSQIPIDERYGLPERISTR